MLTEHEDGTLLTLLHLPLQAVLETNNNSLNAVGLSNSTHCCGFRELSPESRRGLGKIHGTIKLIESWNDKLEENGED